MKKRGIAIVLLLAMLMTVMPQFTAFANGGLIDPSDPADITYVPMKYTDAVVAAFEADQAGDGDYESIDEIAETSAFRAAPVVEETTRVALEDVSLSEEYMVGIKVHDLSKISESANGMINITIPILYDPNLIEIIDKPSGWNGVFSARLGLRSNKNIYSEWFQAPDGATGNSARTYNNYTINTNSIGTFSDMYSLPLSTSKSTDPPVKGDDFYIAVLKYKFKKAPSEGDKLFTFKTDVTDATLPQYTEYQSYYTAGFLDSSKTAISYNSVYGSADDVNKIFTVNTSAINYPAQLKVTYDANSTTFTGAGYATGVKEGTDNVEKVEEGGNATLQVGGVAASSLLKAPDNMVFDGWYTDPACADADAFDKDTMPITADTTLYAKYINGHKITYHLNASDATWADSTKTSVQKGAGTAFGTASDTLSGLIGGDPSRTGYDFVGWYGKDTDGNFIAITASDIITDTTNSYDVYAMWTRDSSSYTLTFNNNGGDTAADPATVGFNAGDTLETVLGGMPVEPTKTDYVFKGWYKNASGDGAALTASDVLDTYHGSAESFTVYARWDNVADKTEPPTPKDTNTIQVKFNKNGGEYKPSGATTDTAITDKYVKSGDKLKMPLDADMSYTGKAFGGWYTSNDGGTTLVTKVDDTTAITSSLDGYTAASPGPGGQITLYAKWLDKVKIEYDLNGLTTGTKPADQTDLIPGATDLTIAAAPTDIAADYSITEWNTKANGTGDSYAPGATNQTVPAADTKLYAIWDYNGADAITVTFDGNGTTAKPATLTPNDGGSNTGKYTVKRAPNYVITADQQPTATRTDYEFDHWDASPSAATTGSLAAITVTDESGSSARTMTRYGIWKVSDSATKVKVTFNLAKHADATSADTLSPASIAPIEIASGDSLGSKMPSDPTLSGGYGFDKWEIVSGTVTGKSAGDAFDKDDIVTADTTVKSDWTKEVKITFDSNGGTLVGTSPDLTEIKVNPGSNVAAGATQGTNNVTTLPTVEKDGYLFDGWYDKDNPGTKIEATTNLSSSVTVKAKWKAKISLDFTSDTETYDGTAKTPLTDSNIIVDLLNYTDNTVKTADITGLTASDFAIKYRKNGTSDAFAAGDPTNAGKYDIEVTMANSDGHVGTDEFTVYTIQILKKNLFTIEQQEVNLKIKNNYQYAANTSGIVPMTVEVVGTAPTGFNLATDLVVKFKKGTDPETTTVPTDFGEYTVTIEPAASSNFKSGTISTDYDTASPAGDQNLHIIRTVRTVNVDYGAGTHLTGTQVGSTGNVYTYKTVTIPTPSPVTKINDAKTALASQSPALDLPKEGTDFTAPSGKRIKYFVTDPTDETNTKFTATSDIAASADDLTIYAIYENAEWTATFNDTKTTGKEDTVKYTIGSEKAIADASGTQKIETSSDGTTWTEDTSADKTKLPALKNAPDNKTFLGWTKNKTLADGTVATTGTYSALKASDFDASATYDGELFTDANKPGDSYVGTETNLQLYAVYVLSGDAKLKTVSLKEDNASGADAKFANSDYTIPATAITFDPDTDTYTAIISNGKDLFAELTPSQPGATITVTKATADANNTSPTGTAVSGISTPDSTGKVNFTSTTDATTYTTADGNTVNQFKVKVTAPDGTEKTYTFNVLEYAKPEIKLNYGNSPYGEIMKASNIADTDKAAAKAAFNVKNKYDASYIPANATAQAAYTYGTRAWTDIYNIGALTPAETAKVEDPSINMDRNDYAIFVYNEKPFVDPGFKATDALGKEVVNLTRKISVDRMKVTQLAGLWDTNLQKDDITITDKPSNYLITEVTKKYVSSDSTTNRIRPNVYSMEYSFTDSITGDTVKVERNVVVLQKAGDAFIGDAFLIGLVNDSSVNPIYAYLKSISTFASLTGKARNIYFYRVLDTDSNNVINDSDANPIYAYLKSYKGHESTAKNPLASIYVELPDSI